MRRAFPVFNGMKFFQVNLLPDATRHEVEYLLLRRVALRLGIVLAIMILALGAMLLPAYFNTALQKADILREQASEEQNPVRRRAAEVDAAVQVTNRRIRLVKNALASSRSASQFLAAILSEASPGLHFERIAFDRDSRTLTLTGKADVRTAILDFQKRIQNLPAVESIVSPISNLIRESAVPFTIMIVAKP